MGSYNNIGLVYSDKKDNKKALEYYEKALALAKKTKKRDTEADILTNIAFVHGTKKEHATVLAISLEAAKIREEIEDLHGASESYRVIGEAYMYQGEYEKASQYLTKALKIATDNEDLLKIALVNSNIGDLSTEKKDFRASIPYYNKGYEIGKEIGSMILIKEAVGDLKDSYAQIGDFKKAHEMGELYLKYQDSLFNNTKSQEIGKLEGRYDLERKLDEDKRNKDKKDAEEKVKKQRSANLQYSLILLGILLAFTVLLLTSKLNLSVTKLESIIFFLFLVLFEFILVFTEPMTNQATGGEPLYMLLINVLIAILFTPMHKYLEKRVKKVVVKEKIKK